MHCYPDNCNKDINMALTKRVLTVNFDLPHGLGMDGEDQGDGMGGFLVRVQENLDLMKEKLAAISDEDKSEDMQSLSEIIARTEEDLLQNKRKLVQAKNDKALEIELPVKNTVSNLGRPIQYTGPLSTIVKPQKGLGRPSPGRELKDFLRLKAVINPRHQHSRKVLNETFQIPLPTVRTREREAIIDKAPRLKPLPLPPVPMLSSTVNKQKVVPGLRITQPFMGNKSSILRETKETECEDVFITSMKEDNILDRGRPVSNITQSTNKDSSLAIVPLPTPVPDHKANFRLIIYKGTLTRSTYEFDQFQKFYNSSWGPISAILLQLEQLSRDYTIPVVFVDVDALVDLALYFEEKLHITTADLLTCLQNREDVEKLLGVPGRRFLAPDGAEKAAIKIQAVYRRHKDRDAYLRHRRQTWAAGLIALSWVMTCKRTLIRKQLQKSKIAQLQRFRVRASNLKRNWQKIQNSKRVIVHIPSAGFDQQVRKKCSELSSYENCQISRIFDLADDNVEVIYVSPLQMSDEVKSYYTKLLTLCGYDGQCNPRVPFKFVVPDGIGQFPTHNMCLSSILKYSPKTLIRLRSMIKGKVAYIVPGLINEDDLYVADFLDTPILGTEPEVSHLYSMKSGRRRIFESAGVECAPGEFDIYNSDQLYESLAKLVTENLDVPCWFFKIDNEFNGRGTAYCNVIEHLQCYQAALKERQRYGGKWSKRWAWEPTFRKILAEIPGILAKFAKPLKSELHPSWMDFLKVYLSTGGVVEGSPPSESTTVVSVDALITPTSEITILSAADQIQTDAKSHCIGFTVPQLSVQPDVLIEYARKVANACIDRGICGFVNISFITFIDPASGEQKLWALNLKLSYSESLCMTKMLQLLTNGTIDPADSSFKVPIIDHQQLKGSRRRAKSDDLAKSEKWKAVDRYAVVSSRLHHSDMSNIRYGVLFQLCKALGIGYDKDLKIGTVFNLLDEKRRECFGMVVLSETFQEALSTFAFNLSSIHYQISSPSLFPTTNVLNIVEGLKEILKQTDQNLIEPYKESEVPYTINRYQIKKDTVESSDVKGMENIVENDEPNVERVQDIVQTDLGEGVPHPSPVSDLN